MLLRIVLCVFYVILYTLFHAVDLGLKQVSASVVAYMDKRLGSPKWNMEYIVIIR